MLTLFQPACTFPKSANIGFSAFIANSPLSSSAVLTNWKTSFPFFKSTNFSESSGNYTVPATGTYFMEVVITYITNGAISVSMGMNPTFIVRRISPSQANILSGTFPIINIGGTVTVRTILGNGQVVMSGVVQLTKGDLIDVYYNSDGMTIDFNLLSAVWAVNLVP